MVERCCLVRPGASRSERRQPLAQREAGRLTWRMQLQIRRSVESEIRTAFRGVTLGRGISLRQAQFDPACKAHSAPPAHGQITDDWSQVPLDELENDFIAHLDALGFRYYIPALM